MPEPRFDVAALFTCGSVRLSKAYALRGLRSVRRARLSAIQNLNARRFEASGHFHMHALIKTSAGCNQEHVPRPPADLSSFRVFNLSPIAELIAMLIRTFRLMIAKFQHGNIEKSEGV